MKLFQKFAPLAAAFVFTVLACGASSPSLQAQTTLIDGNFTAYSATQSGAAVLASPSNTMATPDTWNGFFGPGAGGNTSLTASNLVDSSNTATSVGLSATYAGSNNDPSVADGGRGTATDANTAALMGAYVYGSPVVTLSGLTAYTNDTFELVVYAAGDVSGQGSAITLGGNVSGGNTGSALNTTGVDRMISNGQGDAYQIFTGTIAGDTITFNESGEINGFQLEISSVPEPATWVMGAAMLALVGVVLLRRVIFELPNYENVVV